MSRFDVQALVPVLLVLLTWGRSFNYDFVWDDAYFVAQNAAVHSPESWPRVFTSLNAQADHAETFRVFRPLRTLHYIGLYALGGKSLRPTLFHAANLVWHAAVVLLLYGLCLTLLNRCGSAHLPTQKKWLACAVAAGFAVHPLTAEVVCWVKSLDDLMATAATLACVWAAIALRARPASVICVLLLFATAIYSKVSALPLIFCLPLIYRFAHHLRGRVLLGICVASALTGTLYLVHRHSIIGQSHQVEPLSGSYGQTLVDTIATIPIYGRLLLGIPPFRIDYSYLESGHALSSTPVLSGLAILLAAGVLIVLGLRRRQWRCAALGLFWAAIFFAPVSNILPMMQYMAERFAYLPLVGLVFALFITLAQLLPHNTRAGTCVAICLFWCAMSWFRGPIWKDDFTLFVSSSQQTPRVQRVINNAVKAALREPHLALVMKPNPNLLAKATPAQFDAAMLALHKLDRLYPEHELIQNAIGLAHVLKKDPAGAIPYFHRAQALNPSDASLRDNLIQATFDAGQLAKVITLASPDMTNACPSRLALQALAGAHWQREEWAQASQVWQRITRLYPDYAEPDQRIASARKETAPVNNTNASELVFVYIHGFGGEKANPEFCNNLRAFLKSQSLPNRVINYEWDSVAFELLKGGAAWREAEARADAEALAFKSSVIDALEKDQTPYVLIGFSIGTRVLLRSLTASAGTLKSLRDVYFLGSAMPRDEPVDEAALPQGRKIMNYHSPKWDIVHQTAFSFMNRLEAGGQTGFDSTNTFENMPVSCTHTHKGLGFAIDYSQLAVAIAYIALYHEGVTIGGKTGFNLSGSVGEGDTWWNKVLRVRTEINGEMQGVDIEQHAVAAEYFRAVLIAPDGTRRRIARGHNMHAILEEVGAAPRSTSP